MLGWRRDGKELFDDSLDGKLMSVDIQAGKGVQAGAPKELFETLPPTLSPGDFYDVSADGQRFLVTLPANQGTPPLSLVVNWTAGLRK